MGQPQNPYMSMLAFERAAPYVQANQGMAYLQGIQNHQDEIAQQAQNLRIQQEAQLAAEQATQGLAGIQPDHPQYLNQRQQILQQNPNALLNPQFRNALGIYDAGYKNVSHQRDLEAKQIQAQRQQAHSLGLRAIEYGAPPDVVAEHVQSGNVGALAQIAGEARRAGLAKPKGSTEKDYRDAVYADMVKNANDPSNLPQIGKDETGKVTTIDDVLKIQADNAAKAHRIIYPEKYEQAKVEAGATDKLAPAINQTGSQLKKVLNDSSGLIASPDQIKQEIDAHINSPEADETFFTSIIGNKEVDIPTREKSLNRFREFVQMPPRKKTGSISEGLKRGRNLEGLFNEAEKTLEVDKDAEKANRVWDKTKANVEAKLRQFADSLNIPVETLVSSLSSNETLTAEEATPEDVIQYGNPRLGVVPVRNLFVGKTGLKLGDKVPEFEPLKNLKHAGSLGLDSGKNWSDVLDAYLQEKSGNAPPATVALPRPSSPEEAAKLPAGSQFIGPDGTIRVVPHK